MAKIRNKPRCPECDKFGKVYPTSLLEENSSFACRRCGIWIIDHSFVKPKKQALEYAIE